MVRRVDDPGALRTHDRVDLTVNPIHDGGWLRVTRVPPRIAAPPLQLVGEQNAGGDNGEKRDDQHHGVDVELTLLDWLWVIRELL